MKSLLSLHLQILQDAGSICAVKTSRDAITIASRVENEGESFLTLSLSYFLSDFETGLRDGKWPGSPLASNFSKRGGIPVFLRGFLTRVFSVDGTLLDAPDTNCIWAVRQICGFAKKLEGSCSPARERAAFRQYLDTDREVGEAEDSLESGDFSSLSSVFLRLFASVLDPIEAQVASFGLIPKHGPGAVADKLNQRARWNLTYWTERLESVFPHWNYSSNLSQYGSRDLLPLELEIPVRVVSVPKTAKAPRIIAIEPSTVQYAQQSLKRELYRAVERSSFIGGMLDFSDQQRNRDMARLGSIDGSLATLDLSEASDRVSLRVVSECFSHWPHLRDFLLGTRSIFADVQGEIISLRKFASMGSALTFPIEAMVFLAIIFLAGEGRPDLGPGTVSVYGDDIIIPTDLAAGVIDCLELYGLKVNRRKSFYTGKFRESCGAEFYAGDDVSYIRISSPLPQGRQEVEAIARTVDLRNRLYEAGLWSAVRYIDDVIPYRIPSRFVLEEECFPSGSLYRSSFLNTRFRARWDENHQVFKERYPHLVPLSDSSEPDGEPGVWKWFLSVYDREEPPLLSKFDSTERPHSFHIKWGAVERRIF